MTWHIDGTSPLYLQLADDLRRAIISGEHPSGERIASVRELASDAKVNPNTMQRALLELEREGLVETHGTSGKFVTDDESIIECARKKAVDELISEFTARLSALGCDLDEAILNIRKGADENE